MTISPEPIPDEVLEHLPGGFHLLWLQPIGSLLVVQSLTAGLDIVDEDVAERLFR